MNTFNVIVENNGIFEPYDILPYLVDKYKETKKSKSKVTPTTVEEFKEFVIKESMYQFWAKCEYEIVLFPWPPKINKDNHIEDFKQAKKIDVHEQIMNNIDVVTKLLMENVQTKKR